MTRMTSSRRQTRLTVFLTILSLVVLMNPGTGQAQTTDITSSGLGMLSARTVRPPLSMVAHALEQAVCSRICFIVLGIFLSERATPRSFGPSIASE